MTGEYWLAKAQSDGTLDVSANTGGMVGGVYLPRRTSQRRIGHALGLSVDAATAAAKPHPSLRCYRPFLKPPVEHGRHHQPGADESAAQRKVDAAKQVSALFSRTRTKGG